MLAIHDGSRTIKCVCVQLAKPLILYVNNNYHLFIHLKMDRNIETNTQQGIWGPNFLRSIKYYHSVILYVFLYIVLFDHVKTQNG
jgi:hypothetical protein